MRRMFVLHIPFADIEGCWQATLIDPRWETEALTMAIVEEKLVVYRANPDGYRTNMLTKRRVASERDKRMQNHGQQRTTSAHLPSNCLCFPPPTATSPIRRFVRCQQVSCS
jgi:hypothetical protein